MALLRYASAETANIAAAKSEAVRQASMVAAIAKRDAVSTADDLASAAAADKALIVDAPTLASDPGSPGEVAFDGSFFYVCVAEDEWLRCAIATW